MDKSDSQILQELQYNFPLSERPYEVIADSLEISHAEFRGRVRKIPDEGIIRRMRASFDSNKLGFRSTLAAVSLRPKLIDRADEIHRRVS